MRGRLAPKSPRKPLIAEEKRELVAIAFAPYATTQ
jgi:hypothetical protein